MRKVWFVMALSAMVALVFLGCMDEPATHNPVQSPAPAGNNQVTAPDITGGGSAEYLAGHPSRPGGNGTLDNDIFFSQTIFNTDFVSAGVGGMRGFSTATITLAGLVGNPTLALLYWNGPTNSLDPNENANVMVNGNAVTGTNIGFSSDNCWGYDNSQAWVADVTAIVTATGNGAYNLSNFGTPNADNNGASLIVFFHDADNTNNRDVVIFHGNDSNTPNGYDADGWNVNLPGINYTSGTANIQLHVGDGQVWLDDALSLNGDPTFVPGPQIFDGTSVPHANDGPGGNGSLWDIRTWDITSYLSPGPNNLTLTTGFYSDCLSLVVAIIDLPAGAAPEQPVSFDFHPNSCPNPFNPRSQGISPAAICGTAGLDVNDIDPSTITLLGVSPSSWGFEDVSTPEPSDAPDCECNSLGPDGVMDLILKFDTPALATALGPVNPGQTISITISFSLYDGTQLTGDDCIRIVGGKGSNGI